jgi:hypothetical protein
LYPKCFGKSGERMDIWFIISISTEGSDRRGALRFNVFKLPMRNTHTPTLRQANSSKEKA